MVGSKGDFEMDCYKGSEKTRGERGGEKGIEINQGIRCLQFSQ